MHQPRQGPRQLTAQDRLRVLFFSDTHLGFDYPLRPRVPMRHRGQSFFDNFQMVLDHAVRTRPDLVVHGGDLFFRRRVPAAIVDMVYDSLLRFAENGIPVFIVPGNHEGSRLPPSLWLEASNIHVFDGPRTFETAASGQTVAVSGFPFVRHEIGHRFKGLVDETGWGDSTAQVKLLCIHQAVDGAQFGPSNFTFRAGKDVVRISDIPEGFAAVLTGHIHRRQVLGTRRLPVVYPGSIERTSFAERDEPKGFFEISLGPDRAGAWRALDLQFHELPSRPMIEIVIDPADSHTLREYLCDKIADIDLNSIVRLKWKSAPDIATRRKVSTPFLRSVFPASMNLHLGLDFFREELRASRNAEE